MTKYGDPFTSLLAFKCVYFWNNPAHPWRTFKAARAMRNCKGESPARA